MDLRFRSLPLAPASRPACVTTPRQACPNITRSWTHRQLLPIARGVDFNAYPSSAPGPPRDEQVSPAPAQREERLGAAATLSLTRASGAMIKYGWVGFWVQLTLSVVSSVILLFSVAFTSQCGPTFALWLTLIGIVAGYISCFWSYGYTRTGIKLQQFLDGVSTAKVKKQKVVDSVTKGVLINLVGMGTTLLGISALVGMLVAKTLTSSSANPFMAATTAYKPVLALDVFLVQAATNTVLAHFLSLVVSLWLLNVVGEGTGIKLKMGGASNSSSSSSSGGTSSPSSPGYSPTSNTSWPSGSGFQRAEPSAPPFPQGPQAR